MDYKDDFARYLEEMKNTSEDLRVEMATVQMKLGKEYFDNKNYRKSFECYNYARFIYMSLTDVNLMKYGEMLAGIYHTLGDIGTWMCECRPTIEMYENSMEMYQNLMVCNPQKIGAYNKKIIELARLLSSLYSKVNRHDDALGMMKLCDYLESLDL